MSSINKTNNVKIKAERTALTSVFGNLILAIIKAIAGILGNSFALIADAIESTTDVFSSILTFLGIKYANKPADENHPYGHGKAEPLVTFAIVGFLVVSATFIAIKSIENLSVPQEAPKPFTLIVLGAIIIIKEAFYRFVHKRSEETRSTTLEADAWHHRSDAITSLMAFIGISLSIFMGEGWEKADDWAALAASGIIIYNAFLIFRPALGEIMDEHQYPEFEQDIRLKTAEVEGVVNTEKLFVRKHGMFYHVDMHLIVNADITVKEGHEIAHHVKDHLMGLFPEIHDVHIHIEPAI